MSGCIFPVHRERIVRSVFTCWEGCWVFSLCAIWPPSACNKWLLPADAVINIIHFGPFFCNMEAISSNSCMTWQPQCIVSDRTFEFQNMLSRLKYVFFYSPNALSQTRHFSSKAFFQGWNTYFDSPNALSQTGHFSSKACFQGWNTYFDSPNALSQTGHFSSKAEIRIFRRFPSHVYWMLKITFHTVHQICILHSELQGQLYTHTVNAEETTESQTTRTKCENSCLPCTRQAFLIDVQVSKLVWQINNCCLWIKKYSWGVLSKYQFFFIWLLDYKYITHWTYIDKLSHTTTSGVLRDHLQSPTITALFFFAQNLAF